MAHYNNDQRREDRGRDGRNDWERTRRNVREQFGSSRDDDDQDENYWDDPDGYGIRARGYESGSRSDFSGGRDDMRDRRYSRSGTSYDRTEGSSRTGSSFGQAGSYSGPGYGRERQQYGARGSHGYEPGSAERGGRGYGSGQHDHEGFGSSYGSGSRSQYGGASYFTGQQHGWAQPSSFGDRSSSRYGADYRSHGYGGRDMESSDDRGFFERAGDEIASWFGDEEAARRREMDHRGRGPAGYRRSDERICEDANDRLTDDPRIDASRIMVSAENGEITLNGTVTDRSSKRRAEDCVESISGVRHVQNNLRVEDHRMTYSPSYGSATASTYGGSTGTSGAATGSASGMSSSGTGASGMTGSGSSTTSTGMSGSSTATTKPTQTTTGGKPTSTN